jgi:hypothetical protein
VGYKTAKNSQGTPTFGGKQCNFSKDLSVFTRAYGMEADSESGDVSMYFNEYKRTGFIGNALKPASIWALRTNRQSLSTGLSTFLWKVSADRATIEAPTTTRLGNGLSEDEWTQDTIVTEVIDLASPLSQFMPAKPARFSLIYIGLNVTKKNLPDTLVAALF